MTQMNDLSLSRRALAGLALGSLVGSVVTSQDPNSAKKVPSSNGTASGGVSEQEASIEFKRKVGLWKAICAESLRLKDDYQHYLEVHGDLKALQSYSTAGWAEPETAMDIVSKTAARNFEQLRRAQDSIGAAREAMEGVRGHILGTKPLYVEHPNVAFHALMHDGIRGLDEHAFPFLGDLASGNCSTRLARLLLSPVCQQRFDPVEYGYRLAILQGKVALNTSSGPYGDSSVVTIRLKLEINPNEILPGGFTVNQDTTDLNPTAAVVSQNSDRRDAPTRTSSYSGRFKLPLTDRSSKGELPTYAELTAGIDRPAPLSDDWHWFQLDTSKAQDSTSLPPGVAAELERMTITDLKAKLSRVVEATEQVSEAIGRTTEMIRLGEVYLSYRTTLQSILGDVNTRYELLAFLGAPDDRQSAIANMRELRTKITALLSEPNQANGTKEKGERR